MYLIASLKHGNKKQTHKSRTISKKQNFMRCRMAIRYQMSQHLKTEVLPEIHRCSTFI